MSGWHFRDSGFTEDDGPSGWELLLFLASTLTLLGFGLLALGCLVFLGLQ
jgi:hypothetical protein